MPATPQRARAFHLEHPGPSRLVTREMSWHAPHARPACLAGPWLPVLEAAGDRRGRRVDGADAASVWRCPPYRSMRAFTVALQIYVGGSVESWTLSGAFGQPRLVGVTISAHRRPRGGAGHRAALASAGFRGGWPVRLVEARPPRTVRRRHGGSPAAGPGVATSTMRSSGSRGMPPDLTWRYLTRRDSFHRSSLNHRP